MRSHRTCTVYVLKDVRYLGGFFFALKLPLLFPWPSRKVIDVTIPPCFAKYPSTRVIIDCIDRDASAATNQSFTSNRDTLTVQEPQHIQSAVGISPCGLVTFLSPLWGGRVSDREITGLVKDDKMLEKGAFEAGER